MRALAALPLLFLACATPRGSAPLPETRYRVGDYVVYRYSGSFSPEPVLLREQISEQQGNRLSIDVTATRGTEQRHWLQVVTDTPENERNNVIDELYELDAGGRRRLANEHNADAFRLYSWTIVMPEGRSTDSHVSPAKLSFAGREFGCEVSTGRNTLHGREISLEFSECADFLWTHGPGRIRDVSTGEDVLKVEVVEAGRAAP